MRTRFLLSVLVLAVILSTALCYIDITKDSSYNDHYDSSGYSLATRHSSLQAHERKKRFLGLVVGGVAAAVGIAGMITSRKAAEAAAKRHEELMGLQRKQICMAVCVSEWGMWERCSRPCGGGIKNRTRVDQRKDMGCTAYPCPYKLVQQEHCNVGCPHGGTPSDALNGCECKDGWKGICCTEETICRYPGKPKNGQIHGTWPAKYRSVATFTCNPGYALVGNEELRCLPNETWDGTAPECKRIYCPKPKTQPHVQILNDQDLYRYEEDLVYICDDGYALRGPEKRTCQADEGTNGRWTGFNSACLPVKCDDPGTLDNGQRSGESFKYGSSVNFTCDRGYKLIGSASLKCMASGNWLGRFPECAQIQCEPPLVPQHGRVLLRRATFGAMVSFICDDGYVLKGNKELKCEETGMWSGTEPECKAADCKNPGIPENGAKDGSLYYYPHNITYHCYNGYKLLGSETISCQENGVWSSPRPTCDACDMGTYMDDIKAPGKCTPCPPNTHTLTKASTSKLQCICDKGFMGPEGGPCQEIRCEDLSEPAFGSFVGECDNKLNATCYFACDDGYIFNEGSSMRTCQQNSMWDGEQPVCAPCLANTYKSGDRSCLPCPANSHTVGEANMQKGCICNDGFEGDAGGPCVDIDECKKFAPCEDTCENKPGSYQCHCFNPPGYKVNPDDKHKCMVETSCRNFTQDDAPRNGGLVCHWFREQNSQQCSIRCDKGYEFPSRVNAYETCGPTTGYIWSHQQEDENAQFFPCVEEYYPEFHLEGDAMYFVTKCSLLTEEQKTKVKEEFAEVLNQAKVCEMRDTKVCSVKDMAIICGRDKRRRRRRDTGEEVEEVSMDLNFNVTGTQATRKYLEANCPILCNKYRVRKEQCDSFCGPYYRNLFKAALKRAQFMLNGSVVTQQIIEKLRMRIHQMILEPERIRTSDILGGCLDPGMMLKQNGVCVACTAGSYLDPKTQTCTLCPLGTYQLLFKQQSCEPCTEGTTTYHEGAKGCEICRNGTYGLGCKKICPQCAHGECHPVTGECLCQAGWEGPLCDQDTNACKTAKCFKDVTCYDEPAPKMGYTCGPCPAGYHGDGADCVPVGEKLPKRR